VSHGYELDATAPDEPPSLPGPLGVFDRLVRGVNRLVMALGGIALVLASLVLTYSVVVRYLLKIPTDWQDETAVFLIIGAVFLSAAAVQARRGHVGIEAVASLMSPEANRIRLLVVDVMSVAFCAFFAWKSWTLFHDAWVDDQRSNSSWGPPLWIPYCLMASGMTLLSVQVLLQVAGDVARRRIPSRVTSGLGGTKVLAPAAPDERERLP
jgi:TRAP-type C4-dicarboxylate transport system permease small subunit